MSFASKDPKDIQPVNKSISDLAKFDPQWIDARTGPEASTELSQHRTHLSEHRTDLSEHRTGLSEHRTELSEHRTGLSRLRSHLSNERTHLSYLRTAVSLIGFGITLNRFSIYLQQEKKLSPTGSHLLLRDTSNVGSGMAVLGVVLLIWSLYRYWLVSREIEAAEFVPRYRAVALMTIALLVLGCASAIWLFTL